MSLLVRQRTVRNAVIGASMSVAAALAPGAANSQQVALTPLQCSDAISIANAIVQRNKGKLSRSMIDSFVQFGRSKCDLGTKFVRENAIDNEAFKEFRLHLIAMRTAAISQPRVLANK